MSTLRQFTSDDCIGTVVTGASRRRLCTSWNVFATRLSTPSWSGRDALASRHGDVDPRRSPRGIPPTGGPLVSGSMARVETTGDPRRKANWEARYQAIIDTSAGV